MQQHLRGCICHAASCLYIVPAVRSRPPALHPSLPTSFLTTLPYICCLPPQGDRRPKRRRKQLHDLSGVGSVGIVARGPLDEYRFNMFMRDLLAEKAKDIFRCKGVLAVHVSSPLRGWRLVVRVLLVQSVRGLPAGLKPGVSLKHAGSMQG